MLQNIVLCTAKNYPAPNVKRVSLRTPALAVAMSGTPAYPSLCFSHILSLVIQPELHIVSCLCSCYAFCSFFCLEFCGGCPPNPDDYLHVFQHTESSSRVESGFPISLHPGASHTIPDLTGNQ